MKVIFNVMGLLFYFCFIVTFKFAFCTDLGDGNKELKDRYLRYVYLRENKILSGCFSNPGRRILISGFAPFMNRRNISGYVVSSLGKKTFFPNDISISDISDVPKKMYGTDYPGQHGGKAIQRTLIYNGEEYELCLVLLEVQWDLAASILLYEAERFKPEFILMTGYGAENNWGIFESHSVNKVMKIRGFDSKGNYSDNNIPVNDYIFNDEIMKLKFSLDTERISSHAELSLNLLNNLLNKNYSFYNATSPSKNNYYICNNLGHIVLSALEGNVKLGEGVISITSNIKSKVGFFHYPKGSITTGESIWGWSHVVLNMIESLYR